jgi:LPS-assembly protein
MVSTQSLRPFDTEANLPLVAPALYGTRRVNLDDWGLKGFGELNLRAAGLYTEREDFIKVGRINAEASWSRRTILPGGFVLTPFAGLRLDQYEISRANSDDQSLGRDAWWAGSELSWPLYTSSGGVGFIVEPKVMFATGTEDPNDPDIFNQDSLSFSADAERILDAQPIDGFDLLDEGTRVAVGVQTQARWGGQNRFGLFVGQRFSDADKPALSRLSNLDREQSDIVSRIQLGLGGLLSADTSLRYDAEESELTAASTLLNLSLGPATLGVGHYFTSDLLTGTSDSEALALTSRVRLSPNWAVLGRMTRNLATEENVQQRLGLEYSDDCSTFQLLVERDRNEFNRNRVSTNIRFRIALRTLAEFGANDD